MKSMTYLTIVCVVLTILLAACTNSLKDQKETIQIEPTEIADHVAAKAIYVHKSIDNNDEPYISITNPEQIRKIEELLGIINWEIAKVDMIRPPDYRLILRYEQQKSDLYMLWHNPERNTLEIVNPDESKYAKVDEDTSIKLLALLNEGD